MKLKHTMAKAARRVSGFHKAGHCNEPSRERMDKRLAMQPKGNGQHIYGYQTAYLQKICIKDRFGQVLRIKLVPHARLAAEGGSL